MRNSRLGVAVALLAVASALAGCGSGARAHASNAAGGGGHAGTGSPQSGGRIAKARAEAFVKAVNLRASDLPGFKGSASKERQTAAQKQLSAGLKRCLGAGSAGTLGASTGGKSAHALAAGSSEEYERKGAAGFAFAQSKVSVSPSAAGAAARVAALRSGRVRYCLQRYLNLLFAHRRHGSVSLGRVSVGNVTPPAPGAAGGFGWKMTMQLRTHGLSVPLRIELIGFIYGPAEVMLMTGALPLPFPGPAERTLYMLLLKRAESHPL